MRERDRYGRKSIAETFRDGVGWFPTHRTASVAILTLLGMLAMLAILRPAQVGLGDLRVGDCLFIRTSSAGDVAPGARPAGSSTDVGLALLAGGGSRAACDQSHGHEVSAVIALGNVQADSFPGRDALLARVTPACPAAFPGYVGRPLEGSSFVTFGVAPDQGSWTRGIRSGACLVGLASGAFFGYPARQSGR
jgi:hypothetical protein